jgi:Holliday junction resolvase
MEAWLMGKRSLTKGKRGEREAAAEIRRLFGTEATRGRQFCGGPDSPDIVTGLKDVHFEVKRAESLQLYAAMEQAIEDAGGKVPVVLHRKNNQPWLAIVPLDELFRLAKSIAGLHEQDDGHERKDATMSEMPQKVFLDGARKSDLPQVPSRIE